MDRKYNKNNIPFARELRKNMTKEEKHLWYDFLRTYPIKFIRQKTIGCYIVDFYCAQAQLAIELDGSQHFEKQQQIADEERTVYLNAYGITVLRVPNNEINRNFRGVCEYIDEVVKQSLRPRQRRTTENGAKRHSHRGDNEM